MRRSTFNVRRSPFAGAVRTSVTLMGQDIGNTVTVLIDVLILSCPNWNIGQRNGVRGAHPRSKLHPDCFQILVSGKIRRHGAGNSLERTGDGGSQESEEFVESHPTKIGGTEEESVSSQTLDGKISQSSIIVLNPENFRLPIP